MKRSFPLVPLTIIIFVIIGLLCVKHERQSIMNKKWADFQFEYQTLLKNPETWREAQRMWNTKTGEIYTSLDDFSTIRNNINVEVIYYFLDINELQTTADLFAFLGYTTSLDNLRKWYKNSIGGKNLQADRFEKLAQIFNLDWEKVKKI